MKSQEYERIVEDLAANIVSEAEGSKPDVGSGGDNHVLGVSGFDHQIDVSARIPNSLLLIECKCWKKRIPVGQFLTFLARVIDIRAAEKNVDVIAAMVTTVGYDPGVVLIADYYDIGLEIVESPNQFALRYKKYVTVGLREHLELRDEFDADVAKGR